jgi:hypothetical protein
MLIKSASLNTLSGSGPPPPLPNDSQDPLTIVREDQAASTEPKAKGVVDECLLHSSTFVRLNILPVNGRLRYGTF